MKYVKQYFFYLYNLSAIKILLLLLLTACNYAPSGSSQDPYYPVFKVFMNNVDEIASTAFRCVRKGGGGVMPNISWIDVPTNKEAGDLTSFVVMITSNEPSQNCVRGNDPSEECVHLLVTVNAENTTNIDNADLRGPKVSIAANSWITPFANADPDSKDAEYAGPCEGAGNGSYTYNVFLYAVSDVGPITSGAVAVDGNVFSHKAIQKLYEDEGTLIGMATTSVVINL